MRGKPTRVLLAVCVVVSLVGVGSLLRRVLQPLPTDGLAWRGTATGLVARVGLEEAGIAPGDRLISVDGQAILRPLDIHLLARSHRVGDVLVYTLDSGGHMHDVAIQLRAGSASREYLLLAFVGLGCVATAFRLAQRSRAPGASRAAGAALAFAGIALFSPAGWMDGFDRGLIALDELSRIVFPALLLDASLVLSGSRLRSRWLYAPAAVLVSLNAIFFLCAPRWSERLTLTVDAVLVRGSYYQFGLFATVAAVAAGAAWWRSKGPERRRLHWLLIALVGGLLPYLCLVVAPRLLGLSSAPWSSLAVLPMVIVPIALGNAFVGRALRLEALLRTWLTLTVTTLLTAGATVAAGAVAAPALESLGLPRWSAYLGIALVIGAALFDRVRNQLRAWLDATVDRSGYEARKGLVTFARDLAARPRLPQVLDGLVNRLDAAFRPEQIAIYLVVGRELRLRRVEPRALVLPEALVVGTWMGDSGEVVEIDPQSRPSELDRGFEFALPLRSRGKLLGAVFLGSMARGRLDRADRQLLNDLGGYVAVALDNAMLARAMRRQTRNVRELEQFRASVLESLPIGVLIIDLHGRVLSMNGSFRALVGLESAGTAVGRVASAVLPTVFLDPPKEAEVVERQHGDRTLAIGASLLRRRDGSVLARIIVCEDVTARVRDERERGRREKLASVGLLAAGIAHEVNTPLAGIASYVQMLIRGTSAEDTRLPLLQKVEKQSFRASRLVRHLLNFARAPSAGPVNFSLNRAVEESVSLLDHEANRRRVSVSLHLDQRLGELRGREGEIEQVVLNVVKNAIEASPEGGAVRVMTDGTHEAQRVVVEDDGVGISTHDLERIFDPFFTTKERGAGHGLGLSVAYGIVRAHAGEIKVASKAHAGTRIEIELPARAVATMTAPDGAANA